MKELSIPETIFSVLSFIALYDDYLLFCSDSEDELLMESDDKLEENLGRRSKIAVLLTRRQFKHSYIRFSNAYDHFLFNKFPVPFIRLLILFLNRWGKTLLMR